MSIDEIQGWWFEVNHTDQKSNNRGKDNIEQATYDLNASHWGKISHTLILNIRSSTANLGQGSLHQKPQEIVLDNLQAGDSLKESHIQWFSIGWKALQAHNTQCWVNVAPTLKIKKPKSNCLVLRFIWWNQKASCCFESKSNRC